jgi:hypothetical protein
MGEILPIDFACRSSSRSRLSGKLVVNKLSYIDSFQRPEKEDSVSTRFEVDSIEQLIVAAVETMHGRYLDVSLAEYNGLTEDEMIALEKEEEAALSKLSQPDKAEALSRFHSLINSPQAG